MNRKSKSGIIAGWGNYPAAPCQLVRPEKIAELAAFDKGSITRGLGRSYGDASLNTDRSVILMERLNRFLEFDPSTGYLKAEAGISLERVLEVIVPKGWFIPVTPGTRHVTLGGCLACDVHGKNHHIAGSFSAFVNSCTLILPNGARQKCSPTENRELFWATAGGMGLTGVILDLELQLQRIETGFMSVRNTATSDLDATLEFLSDSKNSDNYSVAWIDCLAREGKMGRGIVMNGHHMPLQERQDPGGDPLTVAKQRAHSVPSKIPSLLLNPTAMKGFNAFYYAVNRVKKEPFVQDLYSYFYPLDVIHEWNHFYGRLGFIQYQFVVPFENAAEAIPQVLERLLKKKAYPFLAVLKGFGKQGPGYLSFPKEGFTLALDIPMGRHVPEAIKQVDDLVLKHEGRVYLAKDALLQPESFRGMYPRFKEWLNVKNTVDPDWVFASNLSRRLRMEEG